MRVYGVSPDPPSVLADIRARLALPFPLLSDEHERAVTWFCGGVAHCDVVLGAKGRVRWVGTSENWSDAPTAKQLAAAAVH